MPYTPPHLRNKGEAPKKLTVYKVKTIVETPKLNKEELFESIRLKEYGKADGAWFGDGGP
jgi:hypothetical protein